MPEKGKIAPGGPPEALSFSIVLQGALHELSVAFEVQQAVAAVVERDRGRLVPLLRLEGEVDGPADGVACLRRGNQALRLGEDLARLEGADLVDGPRFDEARVQKDAQGRRGPVVPQAARMDSRGDEHVAERVHLDEGRHFARVTEVVLVAALRHRRDGFRLDGDEPRLDVAVDPLADHWIRETAEIRTAADAAYHEIGRDVREFELLLRFEADDRLMHQDVIQDAPEGVSRVLARDRGLDRLGDRDAERTGMVRVLREELLPDVRLVARARDDLRAVQIHDILPVRLLVVRYADHEHLRLQAEVIRREREGGSPLTRAGLGRERLDPLLGGEVGLGERRVRLVRADGRKVLPFVVDPGGRLEERLEALRSV